MKVLLELLGDVAQLLSTLDNLDSVRPDARNQLRSMLESLRGESTRLIETDGAPDPMKRESLFQRALEALASERLDEALSILDAAVKSFPDDPELHNHLGLVHWEIGNFEKAERSYANAVCAGFPMEAEIDWYEERHRPFLRAMEGQALALYRLGRGEEALSSFEALASMNPAEYMGCRYMAGEIRHNLGQVSEALEDYKLVPTEPAVAYNISLAYFELGYLEKAATALITAFASNRFVAHNLMGRMEGPNALVPGYLASEAYADEFVGACGHLWQRTPGAVEFMRRCYDHPLVSTHLMDHAQSHMEEMVSGCPIVESNPVSVGHLVRHVLEYMDS